MHESPGSLTSLLPAPLTHEKQAFLGRGMKLLPWLSRGAGAIRTKPGMVAKFKGLFNRRVAESNAGPRLPRASRPAAPATGSMQTPVLKHHPPAGASTVTAGTPAVAATTGTSAAPPPWSWTMNNMTQGGNTTAKAGWGKRFTKLLPWATSLGSLGYSHHLVSDHAEKMVAAGRSGAAAALAQQRANPMARFLSPLLPEGMYASALHRADPTVARMYQQFSQDGVPGSKGLRNVWSWKNVIDDAMR